MIKINIRYVEFVIILILLFTSLQFAQTIVDTKHNLSVTGPGSIKAVSESEICIFCHTPHSSSARTPLWNKNDPGMNYTLYNSSTTDASIQFPGGSSLLCLSCHDGSIALGEVLSRPTDILFVGGITTLPLGSTNLGKNLSDDHPVSFLYNSALATQDGELVDPALLTGPVKLENNNLECTSCHDPHIDLFSDFLVASNEYSDLCLYCHQKNYWDLASHKNSTSTWNGQGTDPWPRTTFLNVSANACESCHSPHTADGHFRLLNYNLEEQNCYPCHNSNVANTNIQSQINKPYNHAISTYNGIHDPEEPHVVQTKHVECEDCHNPHAVDNFTANAPNANGFLKGVKGVNSTGNSVTEIQFEYELCYRCHADSPDKPVSTIPRQIEQNNVRLEFDSNNPSFHPVESAGTNTNVPSLLPPYTESSIIYCTDCHASNGNGSPEGPHGSIYPHILKYNYETANYTPESYTAYELCYQCHSRTSIRNDESFSEHKKHLDEDAPCSACHDAHGISDSQGNMTNNTHLMNWDISISEPDPNTGRLEFIDDVQPFRGKCYVLCHGKKHSPKSYPEN